MRKDWKQMCSMYSWLSIVIIPLLSSCDNANRRYLNQKELPPQDAIRAEELINYFSYSYPEQYTP